MKKLIILFSIALTIFAFSAVPETFAGVASATANQVQNQSNVNAGVGSSVVRTSTNQSQGQGQGQTAVGVGGSGGNSTIGIGDQSFSPDASFQIKDSFNGGVNRQFAIPGQIVYPIAPSYFGAPTPGNQFVPLAKLTQYTTSWNMSKIKHILDDEGWGGKDVESRAYVDRGSVSTPADKVIVTATKPKNAVSVEEVGLVTVAITNDKGLSIDAFATTLAEASELVDTSDGSIAVVQFLAEGVLRKMEATGWGIGLSFTGATMSSGQNLGTVSTGGTGWSTGSAGYMDHPWLQALVLKVKVPEGAKVMFETPKAPRDPAIEKKVKELSSKVDHLQRVFSKKMVIEKVHSKQ